MSKQFLDLGISEVLVKALTDINIEIPTEIQTKSIPLILNENNDFVIDETYIDDILATGSPSFNKEVSNNFMIYENDLIPPTQNVSFTYTYNWFIMKINDSYYKWKISQPFIKDDWYAIVINLNATARQLGLFVYNTLQTSGAVNPELTSSLNLIFIKPPTFLHMLPIGSKFPPGFKFCFG